MGKINSSRVSNSVDLMSVNNTNKETLNSRINTSDSNANDKIKSNPKPSVTDAIKSNVTIVCKSNDKIPTKPSIKTPLNSEKPLSRTAQQRTFLPQYRKKDGFTKEVMDPWLRELHRELDRILFPM